ncbi:MAG TPA: TIGR00159 family protein [Lachnospiraceae bacterium]|nr:diadenylate cyclase CdaA [uncultured Lachnoclostridium sp.]HAU88139.1 TIGR00159 family protein [Lachnospiraceae bacterium]
METIKNFMSKYFGGLILPDMTVIDILEIIIIAFALYHIIIWIKTTRAWMLVKGIIVLLVFWFIAVILDMSAILWIFSKSITFLTTAVVIVFQPEIRSALEQIGRKDIFRSLMPFDDNKTNVEKSETKIINDIVKATFELAKTKTGALIVLQNEVPLQEYERTGIILDSVISSQLLINIFEHNTPLHDGAVIIRENRITAATCYLPLSDNMALSKELGTRHRAGVGISEVTDSLTIIVSEETGNVSIALDGELIRGVDGDYLKSKLNQMSGAGTETKKKRKLWKGRQKDEGKAGK